MKKLTPKQLTQIVLDSFEAEKSGDVEWGSRLIHPDFKKTGMQMTATGPFYRYEGGANIKRELQLAYAVKGREFFVWRTAANKLTQTVFVELLETQPESDGSVSTWIYALVCDIVDGKIVHTRHYGDPVLLSSGLDPATVKRIVNGGELPR